MPEGNDSSGEGRSGDGDSSSPALWRVLWRAIRAFFRGPDHDQSLRAQIEEAIDEHEGEVNPDSKGNGDLVPLERQMLRNLLHFSEHDADDVAIPRGEIIAIPASASFEDLVAAFADNGHSRMPAFGESPILSINDSSFHAPDHFAFPIPHNPFLIPNSQFLISHFPSKPHRQPSHDPAADGIAEWMLFMLIIQGVKGRNGDFRFAEIPGGGLLLPESVPGAQVQ